MVNNINDLNKSIENMKSDVEELTFNISEMEKAVSLLEAKPEYPDGTAGYFGENQYIGFLKNGSVGAYPYYRHLRPDLTGPSTEHRIFTPLTEAILPYPVQHDGLDYPGDPDDFVFTTYDGGSEIKGFAHKRNWRRTAVCGPVATYQVIQRAEK